jgi:hypothetical protein
MGADYSFEVKNIEIWEPAFVKHNNSSVVTVTHYEKRSQNFCKKNENYGHGELLRASWLSIGAS